jgi:hypothetical protein
MVEFSTQRNILWISMFLSDWYINLSLKVIDIMFHSCESVAFMGFFC